MEARADVDARLKEARAVPVHLTPDEVKRHCNSFSNGVLWPLFHYELDRIPVDAQDWDAYRAVNERFAGAVLEHYRPGDLVWVHDYHLMLVPSLLRRRLPSARIGFFLHRPFPPSHIFRTLPWRNAILEGLLGADVVGFHAFSYVWHFSTSLSHVLGLESRDDGITIDGRDVTFGVFPMGIDAALFQHADHGLWSHAQRGERRRHRRAAHAWSLRRATPPTRRYPVRCRRRQSRFTWVKKRRGGGIGPQSQPRHRRCSRPCWTPDTSKPARERSEGKAITPQVA